MYRKPLDKCVFLDMGHGKLDHQRKYTTAPSKMYTHKDTTSMHDRGTFYEGVKNADYGLVLAEKLIKRGIHVVPVCHNWKDTDLAHRVNIANMYHSTVQPGIYVSEHSNAITGPTNPINTTARGMSIWTAPGYSPSDELAEKFIEMYSTKFVQELAHNKLKLIQQRTDGDGDYEAKFYVLVQTIMPAVLFETLFFDNVEDAKILMTDEYMQADTDLKAEWLEWAVRRP